MGISIITRNNQITLPSDVRKMKNLKIGDRVLFVINENTIEIKKISNTLIQETAGLWNDLDKNGVEYQKELRKGWKKRLF